MPQGTCACLVPCKDAVSDEMTCECSTINTMVFVFLSAHSLIKCVSSLPCHLPVPVPVVLAATHESCCRMSQTVVGRSKLEAAATADVWWLPADHGKGS